MATNPLIALGATTADIRAPLVDRQNRLNAESSRENAAARNEALKDETARRREDERLQSIATGALEILPQLQEGGTIANENAVRALSRRRGDLVERGIDTTDTDEAFRMIAEGRTGELQDSLQNSITAAERRGLIQPESGGQARLGRTMEVIDASGKPVLIQTDQFGNVKPIEGFTPVARTLDERLAADPNRAADVIAAGSELAGAKAGASAQSRADVELETQPGIAAATDAAKAGVKQSGEAIAQLPGIRRSIANIDDAISAVRDGAATGAIESRFPSLRESSVRLENIASRMGLDVLGANTFGALSEGELKFALATALPQNLDSPALIDWLQDRRAAQVKLADELEQAAIFLGRGNTPADYVALQRGKRLAADEQLQSDINLMTDDDLLGF